VGRTSSTTDIQHYSTSAAQINDYQSLCTTIGGWYTLAHAAVSHGTWSAVVCTGLNCSKQPNQFCRLRTFITVFQNHKIPWMTTSICNKLVWLENDKTTHFNSIKMCPLKRKTYTLKNYDQLGLGEFQRWALTCVISKMRLVNELQYLKILIFECNRKSIRPGRIKNQEFQSYPPAYWAWSIMYYYELIPFLRKQLNGHFHQFVSYRQTLAFEN